MVDENLQAETPVRIGGPLHEYDLSLQVVGDAVDPESISAALGLPPTDARAKGDHRTSRSGRLIQQPTGVWNYRKRWGDLEVATGREVGEVLMSFLDLFPADANVWQRVRAQGTVTVAVVCWFGEENGTALFEPSLLARLVAMGASLIVDVWEQDPQDSND